MKLQIFAIYDKKALAYTDIFHFPQIGQAIRQLEDLLKTKHPVSLHPADYDLYLLGDFDDISGEITPKKPSFIQSALSLIPNQKSNLIPTNCKEE